MPDKNLTDADRAELARMFRQSIDAERLPALAPRATLEEAANEGRPGAAGRREPYSPPKAWTNSNIGQRKQRR